MRGRDEGVENAASFRNSGRRQVECPLGTRRRRRAGSERSLGMRPQWSSARHDGSASPRVASGPCRRTGGDSRQHAVHGIHDQEPDERRQEQPGCALQGDRQGRPGTVGERGLQCCHQRHSEEPERRVEDTVFGDQRYVGHDERRCDPGACQEQRDRVDHPGLESRRDRGLEHADLARRDTGFELLFGSARGAGDRRRGLRRGREPRC